MHVLEHLGGPTERCIEANADDWRAGDSAALNLIAIDCIASNDAHPLSRIGGLPDTPGRATVQRVCSSCHSIGMVTAQGRTEALEVTINGSGDAALKDLTTQSARVVVSGSGDVGVSPRAEANVTINGSGDVSLGSRPARLTSELNGSGEILQD